MASKTWYVIKNGAVWGPRNTHAEALKAAQSLLGFQVHQGTHVYRDEFGGEHEVTYAIEEHEWRGGANEGRGRWVRLSRTTVDTYIPWNTPDAAPVALHPNDGPTAADAAIDGY